MKFYLLACVLFFFTNSAGAQFTHFLPGEITLLSGETKIGYIERTVSEKITYEVNFKENKKDEKGSIYSVDELKSFQFKDDLKFVLEEITYATDAAGKEHITELAFLEELESGTLSLLEFDNQEYRGLFLKKKDGQLVLLAQQEQACADYMSILREEMADCEAVKVKDAMWFSSLIIKTLIQDYNNCGKEVLKSYRGFSYKFLLSGQAQLSTNEYLVRSQNLGVGLRAEVRMGKNKVLKHLMLQMGAMGNQGQFRLKRESIEYNYIKVWGGVKTKLSVNSAIYPIFSVGYAGYIEQADDEFRTLTQQEGYKVNHVRLSFGFQYVKNSNVFELEAGHSNSLFVGLSYGRKFK